MTSHLGLMALFAALVSTVFAVLMRDRRNEQLALWVRIFSAFVITALALGWLMYPFPI